LANNFELSPYYFDETDNESYFLKPFFIPWDRLQKSVSKLFVRLGLLELQERNGQGEVTAQNVWRLDLVGSTLRSPNGTSQE